LLSIVIVFAVRFLGIWIMSTKPQIEAPYVFHDFDFNEDEPDPESERLIRELFPDANADIEK
jgi:hypothetical protein